MDIKKTTAKEVFNTLWSAADTLRGKIDSSVYKDYILTLLFVKAISDTYKEHFDTYMDKYKGNEARVLRALAREKFILKDNCTFDYLYERRDASDIGVTINKALEDIEDENKEKIGDIFRNIDFNSAANLGDTEERNNILKHLLIDFEGLNLRPAVLENKDVIGDAYQNLIEKFASDAGKKSGSFYTPKEVSQLMSELVGVKPNMRVYDPTCGSGSLLIKAAQKAGTRSVAIYGQESMGQTYTLAKMNMFMHDIDDAQIKRGDTLAKPMFTESKIELTTFDRIVSNPPFSLDKWAMNMEGAQVEEKTKKNGTKTKKIKYSGTDDKFKRFQWGTPPMGNGDYAFVLHVISSLNETGKGAVVLPHGVLFRGQGEGKIRKQIVERNLVEAVIGLPPNMFYGTNIPAVIVIFNKNKGNDNTILFIDASSEKYYQKDGSKNILLDSAIQKIVEIYKSREEIDKFSHVASYEELELNEFNLNIPRYIDTFEEEEFIDIEVIQSEILAIEDKLKQLKDEMKKNIKELGL